MENNITDFAQYEEQTNEEIIVESLTSLLEIATAKAITNEDGSLITFKDMQDLIIEHVSNLCDSTGNLELWQKWPSNKTDCIQKWK